MKHKDKEGKGAYIANYSWGGKAYHYSMHNYKWDSALLANPDVTLFMAIGNEKGQMPYSPASSFNTIGGKLQPNK